MVHQHGTVNHLVWGLSRANHDAKRPEVFGTKIGPLGLSKDGSCSIHLEIRIIIDQFRYIFFDIFTGH